MPNESLIFEVSQKSFDKSVLFNSNKLPVLVNFIGVWSGPCIAMTDLFAQLANEFSGQFIYAKIDIDENPELVKEYQIENVPTLLIFKDEKIIRNEAGQLKETEARKLLKDIGIYHEADIMREQAREKHLAGDTPSAILLLTQAIKKDPSNVRVAMDMVQIFIDIGELAQAEGLFNKLPEKQTDTDMGKSIRGQLHFKQLASKTLGREALEQQISQNPQDVDSLFDLSICLVAEYQYELAIDKLFNLLESSPDYKEGAAKEMISTISNMLTPANPDLAKSTRRKLANMNAQ